MKQLIFYKYLLLISLVIYCCVSCDKTEENYTTEEKQLSVKSDSVVKWFSEGKMTKSAHLLDSLFARGENSSPYARYLYYADTGIMEDHYQRYESYSNYADSAIMTLEKNNLTDRHRAEYINALLAKGNALCALTDYKDAYEYYFKVKVITDEHPELRIPTTYINSIAMALYRQKQFGDAAYYFRLDFSNASKLDSNLQRRYSYRMQELLSNIGLCYNELYMQDSALYFYDSAMKFITVHSGDFGAKILAEKATGVVLGNMASVYMDKNSLDTAERLLKESISINMQPLYENDDAQRAIRKLAELYYQKNEMDSMYQTMQVLQSTLDTIKSDDVRIGLKRLTYLYYNKKGDELKSLRSFKDYINDRDSTHLVRSQAIPGGILHELKNKEQQYHIFHLEKDKQADKMALLVAVIISLIVTISGAVLWRNFRKISVLHKQVSAQKKELENSSREKDRILNVVAHDLRSPMGAIYSLTDMLLEDDGPAIPLTYALTTIRTVSNNSMELIKELLTISNVNNESLQLEDADLNEYMRENVAVLQLNANAKQQTIRLTLPEATKTIAISRSKMTRVMANIVGNAIKFSAEGGLIDVAVTYHMATATVAVKDQGIGIPEKLKDGIFELFTDSKRNGTNGETSFGLGLSVAKEIVEAHGGRIWFESEEGKGATFYFEIPFNKPAA